MDFWPALAPKVCQRYAMVNRGMQRYSEVYKGMQSYESTSWRYGSYLGTVTKPHTPPVFKTQPEVRGHNHLLKQAHALLTYPWPRPPFTSMATPIHQEMVAIMSSSKQRRFIWLWTITRTSYVDYGNHLNFNIAVT